MKWASIIGTGMLVATVVYLFGSWVDLGFSNPLDQNMTALRFALATGFIVGAGLRWANTEWNKL